DHVVVLVAVAVVADRGLVHRLFQGGGVDQPVLRDTQGGGFQVGQGTAGVPAGQQDQGGTGLVVHVDFVVEAPFVGQGPADHAADVVVGQAGQRQQQGPGHQRAYHGEERVLGGGPDERHPAVLHRGQQRVLLGLAEPVHLVDEQHRLRTGHAQVPAGGGGRRPPGPGRP